jgi:Flp pilus assembly protein TadG
VKRIAGGAGDRGQATVELALALPLLFIFMLGVVQLAVVLRDQLAVLEAARVGARAAAVALDQSAAANAAATRALGGDGSVTTSVGGDTVTVTVTLVNSTDVPLIGLVLPDVEVRGRASMLIEPP